MYISTIHSAAMSKVQESVPLQLGPIQAKIIGSASLQQSVVNQAKLLNQAALPNQPSLATDVKRLMVLKHKLLRSRRGRGPKRSRRARRQRMHRRFRQLARRLMGRLHRMMSRLGNHRCGQTQPTRNGADFSFLNDASLTMSEKVEMFLQRIIQDSEAKMEELMKKHAEQGKPKSKSNFLDFAKKIAPMAASLIGGPAAGLAASAIGGAINSSADSSKGSSESDQRMTMFKIQQLQDHVKQMFDFFSTKNKKEADLIGNIIRNMA